jgi:uncharacterized protein YbjT (DUF2867 family)
MRVRLVDLGWDSRGILAPRAGLAQRLPGGILLPARPAIVSDAYIIDQESAMAEQKIIAVVGATGAQGGGLVQAILTDPDGGFRVRALTRSPEGEKGAALASRGAEVVHADLDDVDSLRAAFRGADAAFCVTNFWEHFSPEKELSQAANLARAAKEEGVRHVVWSTLEDTRDHIALDDDRMPTLMGKYKVPHFDAKGEANRGFTDLGVPTTFLVTSFYWDNLIYFGMGPKRGPDGVLTLTMPMADARLSGIAAEDIGACAYGIIKRGDAYIGRTVGIAGEHLTGDEMAAAMTDALGEEVRYSSIPFDTFRSLGFPGADDLGNMFQFYVEFGDQVVGARSVQESRRLNPGLLDFRSWLAKYGDRIPRE